jgi:SNF2 family DNA or RNA helicase
VPIRNALTSLIRLRQVTNGLFVFGSDEPSSKVHALLDLLETLPTDSQVIVFSAFEGTVDYLDSVLKVPHAKITGAVKQEARDVTVSRFRAGAFRVLLGTDAMSAGVNLQNASYVVHMDLPWSYARYEQRIGRAWRKGQKQNVTTYILEAEDSVDEHVRKILGKKIRMGDEIRAVTRTDIQDLLGL